jgi:hypothetical protein
MTTYSRRYAAGEHEEVWNDLRALGPVPDHLREDAADVAVRTMRRAAAHLRRLAEDAPEAGLVPLHGGAPVPATPDERAGIEEMDRETGGLPAALAACVCEIGRFSLIGEWPGIGLHHETVPDLPDGAAIPLCDPLDLPGAAVLHRMWRANWADRADEREEGEPFHLAFAPDEVLKMGYGGDTHDIAIPDARADPALLGVLYRPGITLVEYLRVSVAWGGFPGWEFVERPVPDELRGLARTPDF